MTEQVLAAKGPVWDAARAKAKWAGRSLQDRAEIVFVRSVEQRLLMLSDSRVTQEVAPSAGLK